MRGTRDGNSFEIVETDCRVPEAHGLVAVVDTGSRFVDLCEGSLGVDESMAPPEMLVEMRKRTRRVVQDSLVTDQADSLRMADSAEV